MRSLVPIEKKSRCGANAAALSAVAGISTITPTSSPVGTPRPSRADRLVQGQACGEQLVDRADHREHHAHGGGVRNADDREQLVGEQLRSRERQPQAAHAQERVRLRRGRDVVQRLVATDVQRAQREAPASEVPRPAGGRPSPARRRRAGSGPGTGTRCGRALPGRPRRRVPPGRPRPTRGSPRPSRPRGRGSMRGREPRPGLRRVSGRAPAREPGTARGRGRPAPRRPRRSPRRRPASCPLRPRARGRRCDRRDPLARARIALCAVGLPCARTIARTRSGSSPCGLGRRESSAATSTPSPVTAVGSMPSSAQST